MNLRRLFGLLLGLCLCAPALGHEVRPAYLQITELPAEAESKYLILWKQPIRQNMRLPIDPIFPAECTLNDALPPVATSTALIYQWHTDCDLTEGTVHIAGLSVTLTDVLVQVTDREGETASYILRPDEPTLDLTSESAPTLSYLIIGVEHLVFGIDHVLFVVGLFLFIRNPWMLFKTITAFTVSHSITLALSVLDLVRLEQGPVEAIIALSILFLARELTQSEDQRSILTRRSPWIMAFLFGLLHGLGFAGALADIGLPEDALWSALLLFNLGLELGQLGIIALLAGLLWLVGKVKWEEPFVRSTAFAMGCLAAFWTIDRTLLLL